MVSRDLPRPARLTVAALAAGAASGVVLSPAPARAQAAGPPPLALPTAVANHAPPLFPPSPAWWRHDGKGLIGTYRVTKPMMGSRRGTPENYAVQVWQELLTEHGFRTEVDGIYGPKTERAVKAYQRQRRLAVTGRINYPTGRALLARTIKREAKRVGMSADLLCGHLDLESRLNPRAVNPNGRDIGIAQINIGKWNPGVSVREAFDEDYAIRYMARRDKSAYKRYGNWRIAVYSYLSPVDALRWKRSGQPSERAKWYSNRVFEGCAGKDFPGDP